MPAAPETHVQLWQPGDGARLNQLRMQDTNKRLEPSQLTDKDAAERKVIEMNAEILHVQEQIAAADRQLVRANEKEEDEKQSAMRQEAIATANEKYEKGKS